MRTAILARSFTLLAFAALLSGCATSQTSTGWDPAQSATPAEQPASNPEVAEAIAAFKNADPGMQRFFDNSHGYAVFPGVGKGGLVVGGAYGGGQVFEQGRLIGYATITQFTLGAQIGGQSYRQIIFFADKASLDLFRTSEFNFGAQASAVAVTAGAASNAAYNNGVAVFTLPRGGLMLEASIAGQKFRYTPKP